MGHGSSDTDVTAAGSTTLGCVLGHGRLERRQLAVQHFCCRHWGLERTLELRENIGAERDGGTGSWQCIIGVCCGPQELRETEAMAAGNAIHAALEAQTSVALEADVETPEDAWALLFLNMITAIRQLRSEGMTREVYIFGSIQVRVHLALFFESPSPLQKEVPPYAVVSISAL